MSFTVRCLAPVRTVNVTTSPGAWARIATTKAFSSVIGFPSRAVITSPGLMPARSAGPPGVITDCPAGAWVATRTPGPAYV